MKTLKDKALMSTQASMPALQSHIVEYLNFYLKKESEKKFAVMIEGDWGSGKTHFIKSYKNQEQAKAKIIMVSLYGAKTMSDIDRQVLAQVYPFMATRTVRWITKFAKCLVSVAGVLGLPIGKDSEISINLDPSKLNLAGLFNATKGATYIFDDLERSGMGLKLVLGYINYLSEVQGHKVIILANEKGITEERPIYDQIKEKLVGRTFSIQGDFNSAFSEFLKNQTDWNIRERLRENQTLIKQIFDCSKYSNLRSLEHAFIEFQRAYSLLPDKVKNHKPLISDLIRSLFILVFELRKGTFSVDEIEGIGGGPTRQMFQSSTNPEVNELEIIEKKYPGFDFYKLFPNASFWHKFFKTGLVDPTEIEDSLLGSQYFEETNTPSWAKLWRFRSLQPGQLEEQVKILRQEFETGTYRKPGIIKHIAGLFIYFSRNKIISTDVLEERKWIRKVVWKLSEEKKLEIEKKEMFSHFYAGLQFTGLEDPSFKRTALYIDLLEQKQITGNYVLVAEEIRQLIEKEKLKEFWEALSFKFPGGQEFYNVPILKYISPENFTKTYLNCPNKLKHYIGYAFKERYSIGPNNVNLKGEYDWLIEVKRAIETAIVAGHPLDQFILKEFCKDNLDPAIRSLQN